MRILVASSGWSAAATWGQEASCAMFEGAVAEPLTTTRGRMASYPYEPICDEVEYPTGVIASCEAALVRIARVVP
jgi:hypothetical protein